MQEALAQMHTNFSHSAVGSWQGSTFCRYQEKPLIGIMLVLDHAISGVCMLFGLVMLRIAGLDNVYQYCSCRSDVHLHSSLSNILCRAPVLPDKAVNANRLQSDTTGHILRRSLSLQ